MRLSLHKAKAIARTARWHHVGFAFFWATTFSTLVYPPSVEADQALVFRLLNLGCVIATMLCAVFIVRASKRDQPRPVLAIAAGGLLSAGVLLFYAGFYGAELSLPLVAASGICIGAASGMFYLLWQIFFTSEGASRTALYIPLSAVLSAVLCLLVSFVPMTSAIACGAVIFPLLAVVSLYKALSEIEPPESTERQVAPVRAAIGDLWKPVFCVSAIGFVWKTVSGLLEGFAAPSSLVVLGSFGAACLVIALIELFSKRGFEVLRTYQILFPIITGAFLLPTLFGMQFAPMLSGMLMFGFEVVNLLMIITCAVYANERSIPSTYIYALCMTPIYLAMIIGESVSAHLSASLAYDLSWVVGIMFLCVYVLSLTMFLVSWSRHRKRDRRAERTAEGDEDSSRWSRVGEYHGGEASPDGSGDPAPQGSRSVSPLGGSAEDLSIADLEQVWMTSLNVRLDELVVLDPLSAREREVAAHIVRGYSVAGIAKKLFISENTVRGHAKNIYRKLDVHSKQQLIDLIGLQ